uniref:Histone-lysine N-methyltransferase SETMAR n=1 Tax=Heterorhabditis bacteriophora TaxID=37862 RepID=A0A1I7WQ61_HETBA
MKDSKTALKLHLLECFVDGKIIAIKLKIFKKFDQLKDIVEVDPRKTTREVAEELDVDQSAVVQYLHQIGKTKEVQHELNEYQENRRYEICSVLLLRNKNDPFLDRIVTWRKMDSIREPMAFGAVAGPRRRGYGHCLVVGKWDHPLKLLGFWRKHHRREVLPGNRQIARRTATFTSRQILLHDNARPHVPQTAVQKLSELSYETALLSLLTRPLSH